MRRLGSWAGSKTKADLNGRVESRLAETTSPDEVSSAFRTLVEMFETMKGPGSYRRYVLGQTTRHSGWTTAGRTG